MAVNAFAYDKFPLTKDQWYLKSQEVQALFVEVSKLVRQEISIDDTHIIKKYWDSPAKDLAPKLVTLHGDN
jgi:hypothetical protein